MDKVIEDGPPVIAIRTNGSKGTYRDLIERVAEVEKMGTWIARSKMFGCDNEAQGCVIAMECILTGTTLIDYAKRHKIVANKPFMQYDSMLAALHERGGESEIIQSTSEVAEVEFRYRGKTTRVSLTWADLQKETVPYKGREEDVLAAMAKGEPLTLKPKYATPISRKTMLLARLISSTMRMVCPEICYGVYTPEEIGDFTEVEEEVVPTRKETSRVSVAATNMVKPEPAPEEKPAKLAAPTDGPMRQSINEPATTIQVDRIKSLMAECKEAGIADIVDRVKAKLTSSNLARLADLSIAEAELLIHSLAERNITKWVDASLAGHQAVPQ